MGSGRFVGGLLIGGALGAFIGLLIAPRKGEETRELIREDLELRLEDSAEYIKAQTADIKDKAKQKAEALKARSESLAQELEEAGKEVWDKVRTSVKTGKNADSSEN